MIYSILCILFFFGFIAFILVIEQHDTKKSSLLGVASGSAVLTMFVWLVGMFLGGVIFETQIDTPIHKTYLKERVYSLDIKSGGVSGVFFLGCGGFSGDNVQYVMFRDNEGGKELLQVDATYTVVYEDENIHPYIIRKVFVEWDYSTADLWFTHFGTSHWKTVDKYKLHVPKGTIKINPDKIDLSKLN